MRLAALALLSLPAVAHDAGPGPAPDPSGSLPDLDDPWALDGTLALDLPGLAATPTDPDGVWRPVLPVPADSLEPQAIHDLIEEVAVHAPADALVIEPWVTGPDGPVLLEGLLPPAPPVPDRPQDRAPMPSLDHPGATDGALSGRAVYLSQCHGFIWYTALDRFSTQRPNLYDTVEDFHNPEALNQFLAPYLENAGARVFTVKERDHNPVEVIVDDGDPGTTQDGSGFAPGERGWGTREAWRYGELPFRSGGTTRMPADGGGTYTWTVDVPADGHYAVYVSWDSSPDHASDAHYRITHPGGVIDRRFDQRVHGSTWQYVEHLWLTEGQSLTVELIGDSRDAGKQLSIDAVRIGGGTGRIERYGTLTGRPRWEEGAVLSTQLNGAPDSVYDPYNDGVHGSDPPARSRWADWEHPRGEDAVYLSWHSNATANGTARGTVTYIYEGRSGAPVRGSSDLAWSVQDEMITSFQTLWEPGWQDRGVKSAPFSEVNPGHNDEMPAALVELAFHDNATDVAYLKHPRFRRDAARAIYRGIVRYFAERDGERPVFLPEPPVDLALVQSDGDLRLSWTPGPTGAPFGDAPDSYIVQTSPDGRAWSEGFTVDGTTTTLDAEPGEVVYARVRGANPGGVSFPSEVVGARARIAGDVPVLVVDAFDRFETGQLEWGEVPWNIGAVRRLRTERVNPNDIVVPHGEAIAAAGWTFDSASSSRIGDLDLSGYRVVVWATGEESTADETFSAAEQGVIRSWWEGGGALWVTGAEILWDLDHRGTDSDRAFATQVLGATMAADDATTYGATGTGLLEGLNLRFAPSAAPYPVEWPDVLDSTRTPIATYEGGGLAGVLGERVALLGFPFEAINDPDDRRETGRRILEALAPDYEPPDAPEEPDDTDTPADQASPLAREPIGRKGCGCAGVPSHPLPWLSLLAVALLARRQTSRD